MQRPPSSEPTNNQFSIPIAYRRRLRSLMLLSVGPAAGDPSPTAHHL
jgi:hypothetical protein